VKKFNKLWFLLLILLFTACGGSGPSHDNNSSEELVSFADAEIGIRENLEGVGEEVSSNFSSTPPITSTSSSATTSTSTDDRTSGSGAGSGGGGNGGSAGSSRVSDTTPPVVTLNGSASITLIQNATYMELNATATDIVSGNVSSSIVITGRVDTSVIGTYTLTYTAIDSAGNSGTAVRRVNVISAVPILVNSTATVEENATVGTKIGVVSISYVGASAITAIALTGVGNENFTVSADGNITIKSGASLDYESRREYNLTAKATNSSGTSGAINVSIAITNVIDTIPVLVAPVGVSISESVAVGTTVVTVLTNGTNSDENTTDSFTIVSGDANSDFAISSTGVITTAKPLNYETLTSYTLVVKATNHKGDSATVDVVITVTDVIDVVPILANSTATVAENIAIGTEIGTVTINSIGDSPISAITLSGVGSSDFNVTTDGKIKLKVALDYETTTEYNLTAKATNSAGDSSSVKLDVTVINVVDNIPILATPTAVSLNENIAIGSTVVTIFPNGLNIDQNITDSFSIVSGDNNNDFSISSLGIISTAKALDFSTTSTYILVIKATNIAGDSATVDVVIDITGNIPVIDNATEQIYIKDSNISALSFTNTGNPATSCSVLPSLPAGLSIVVNSDTCEITGTPTIRSAKQTYTITASNAEGDDNATVEILVKEELPLIIIRINFDDHQFNSGADIWSSKIFGTTEGELNHYYNEISYGNFQFKKADESDGTANDGIITITLSEDHPDPRGDNRKIGSFQINELKDALSLADTSIDFSSYDRDSNGKISKDELQIMFLIAGGESATGTTPGIWAHQSALLSGDAPTHDGVKLMSGTDGGDYSLFGERQGTHDATIGVIAHELGHAVFGLPDLYDTDGSSAGIGDFGLMGGGSWGKKSGDSYGGQTPVHMTGWSKLQINFVTPKIIDSDTIGLSIKGTAYSDYQLYAILSGVAGEYFLFENRDASGYDRGLYSLNRGGASDYFGGLSILHIDNNQANNQDENHKLVDIEEANSAELDANKNNRGHVNNLFFSGNSTEFTPTTTPNSKRYDGASCGVSITNISATGATMSADIDVN